MPRDPSPSGRGAAPAPGSHQHHRLDSGVIEIRHLRLLRAIEWHGSISGAAASLGYSQPAVTQQLQKLERHLGTSLVVRTSTGTSLSEAGMALTKYAPHIVDAIAVAELEVEAIVGLRAGNLRLATFPSAAATLAAHTIAGVSRRHPGLRFTLLQADSDQALATLRRGDCDLALVQDSSLDAGPDLTGLSQFPLLEEALFACLPPGHPLAGRQSLEVGDLRDDNWVSGCPACRRLLMTLCEQQGFEPRIVFESDDYATRLAVAGRGLGVTVVPYLVTAATRTEGVLVPLRTEVVRSVRVVTYPELLQVPGVQATVAALHDAASRLARACAVDTPGASDGTVPLRDLATTRPTARPTPQPTA